MSLNPIQIVHLSLRNPEEVLDEHKHIDAIKTKDDSDSDDVLYLCNQFYYLENNDGERLVLEESSDYRLPSFLTCCSKQFFLMMTWQIML